MHIHIHSLTPRTVVIWMSALFMLGSACFAGASVGFLLPTQHAHLLNIVYFIGSIPFTIAGYLQFLGATNQKHQDWKWFAYRPQNKGYTAALIQWIGTILFNFNTFDAILKLSWEQDDAYIWSPNMLGSAAFLISGTILLKEERFKFKLSKLEYDSLWINLLGCITFMLSALTSVYLPDSLPEGIIRFATINTLIGGMCFFMAAGTAFARLPK